MALPVAFAALTDATGQNLDDDFAAVGALGVVPCSATGANSIALSPNVNTPTISAYSNYLRFSFVAVGASTGAVTVAVASLSALPLYLPDGVTQVGSGILAANVYYDIAYNSALNGGSGGFIICSMMPISNALDALGATAGSIVYRSGSGWTTLGPGTSGNVLQTTNGNTVAWAAGAGSKSYVLTFASAGGFSFSSISGLLATTVVKLTMTGGGGGGGASSTAATVGAGQGGGAAGVLVAWVSGLAANTVYSGTVGAGGLSGGSAGVNTALSGNAGGHSSISFRGVQFVATGGSGGQGGGNGGLAGQAGTSFNGTLKFPGTAGAVSPTSSLGGSGGGNMFGPGAPIATVANLNAVIPGTGGAGSASLAGANATSGGAGCTGVVIIEFSQ